jgi:hypothetical protein
MNAFYEHHKRSIEFGYRCFDRILLNGLIQPFQQPERLLGFFNTYRDGKRVIRRTLTEIADQFHHWVINRSQRWGAPHRRSPAAGAARRFRADVLAKDRSRSCGRHSESSRTRSHPRCHCRKAEPMPSSGTEAALGESIQFLYQRPTLGAQVCPHVSLLYFPFSARVCLNQHHWLALRMQQQGIAFRQCKNAFLQCADPQRLQQLADSLTAQDLLRCGQKWLTAFTPFFTSQE